MKKLLYTFLAVSLIFSACEEEDAAPSTNNNTGNNNSSLAIGDTHQGGIIFYLDGNGGGLISAPSDQGVAQWGCYEINIIGADGIAIGTGAQNTIDIEEGCTTPATAADICANLTLGGYSDWFLPSKDELNEMFLNIGQGNLVLSNIGNFGSYDGSTYISSTESNELQAWMQRFGMSDGVYGIQDVKSKDQYQLVRAIRAF